MTVDINSPVYGIKDAIKQLNSIEPGLRNQITVDYRRIAKPVIQDAKAMIPQQVPISGMARKWNPRSGYDLLPWEVTHKQILKAQINTKNIREFGGRKSNVGTFVIRWSGPNAVLFDTSTNGRLGSALTAKYGSASRVLWPAYQKNRSTVVIEMVKLVETVMDKVNRNVVQ